MKNKTTLVIVESPAKGHKIQEYLGKDYVVMASKGHITELAKGGKHGLGVDIANNFKPHYVLSNDKIDTLDSLLNAAKKVDQIYLASDPDREGEAIAWHLQERLKDVGKPIKRISTDEINKKALLKAISQARDIDMNLFHSQEARRILDRLVGFMASPFLMNLLGTNLSAGRVQSVVTRLVIDREREIENFVPEDYWTIQVTLSKDQKNGFITKYANKLTDEKTSESVRTKLAASPEYVVSEVLKEKEKKYPAPPLITSSLQKIMSKVYSMSADRTMKAAQSLYENGYCTYIRTDSTRISDDALKDVRDWLVNNKYVIPTTPNIFKNKDAAQDAHECIRPSDLNLLPKNNMAIIDPDEKLVYEVIWKYCIASQMLPAIYNTLKITAHPKNDKSLQVKTSGKALESPGFLEMLEAVDNSKIDLPNLQKDDLLFLFGKIPVKMEKKQTQPPGRYAEYKLIEELEKRTIGRPATYAELLSKICSRTYVEKKGNVYHATALGKKVTDILLSFFTFMDYNYTKDMEQLLDEIESGKVNHVDMLGKFYPSFKTELDKAYLSNGGSLCDKCNSPMQTRISKKGDKFLACSGYPKCRNTKNII